MAFPVVSIASAGVSYLNRPNQDYSENALIKEAYPTELMTVPELSNQQSTWGKARAYVRPVLPAALRQYVPGIGPPQLSRQYQDLVKAAQETARQANDTREDEGNVWINGKLLPGIFQGFKMHAGIYSERVTVKGRDKKIKGQEVKKTFQVDNGDRPVTGSASFILLDDHKTFAESKAKEFIRIITAWDQGNPYIKEDIPRVFTLHSFFNGPGWSGPFNFTRIKILDYSIDGPANDLEGVIFIEFTFEQYDVPNGEGVIDTPLTRSKTDGGHETDMAAAESAPPGGLTFADS